MSERRSSRTRKQVNYAHIDRGESDDDFQDHNTPPTKKPKMKTELAESNDKPKVTKNKKNDSSKQNAINESIANKPPQKENKTSRLSIEEKVFNRQIETAIILSKSPSTFHENSLSGAKENELIGVNEESSGMKEMHCDVHKNKQAENVKDESSEESYESEESLESESEGNDLPRANPKKSSPQSTKNKEKDNSKHCLTEKPYRPLTTKKEPEIEGLQAVKKKLPKWTPPASKSKERLSGTHSANSPSLGLRLGLSRNVRVKSLHTTVKIQT